MEQNTARSILDGDQLYIDAFLSVIDRIETAPKREAARAEIAQIFEVPESSPLLAMFSGFCLGMDEAARVIDIMEGMSNAGEESETDGES